MVKLHYSIKINAPAAKVWDTMLDDNTYRQWTSVFMPGGYYEGGWEKGSKIKFLAPDKDGKVGGMSSEISENKSHEFISIRHLGVVIDGEEDFESYGAKDWGGKAYENYTLTETDGVTEVAIDMDADGSFKDDMEKGWPKALEKLKELAETT